MPNSFIGRRGPRFGDGRIGFFELIKTGFGASPLLAQVEVIKASRVQLANELDASLRGQPLAVGATSYREIPAETRPRFIHPGRPTAGPELAMTAPLARCCGTRRSCSVSLFVHGAAVNHGKSRGLMADNQSDLQEELDQLQAAYKAAVDEWVAAIREEEALASVTDSVAELDKWEAAGFREDKKRREVIYKKRLYEDALRREFFGF
jgi:hypothetical protein